MQPHNPTSTGEPSRLHRRRTGTIWLGQSSQRMYLCSLCVCVGSCGNVQVWKDSLRLPFHIGHHVAFASLWMFQDVSGWGTRCESTVILLLEWWPKGESVLDFLPQDVLQDLWLQGMKRRFSLLGASQLLPEKCTVNQWIFVTDFITLRGIRRELQKVG